MNVGSGVLRGVVSSEVSDLPLFGLVCWTNTFGFGARLTEGTERVYGAVT